MKMIHSQAPGRVNLIGEHTDYNGGYVLPMGLPLVTQIEMKVLEGGAQVRARTENVEGGEQSYTLGEEKARHSWIDYLQGTTWILRSLGFTLGPVDIKIHSEVPVGGGLSSSAALEVSLLRAFRQAFDLKLSDLEIAQLSQRIENEFVGARVGIMDPMAASLAEPGSALFIDTRTLKYEQVPISKDHFEFIVIHSGISHSLAASHEKNIDLDNPPANYNTRRSECETAAEALGVKLISDIKELPYPNFEKLAPNLQRRVRHVVTENARVLKAVEALRSNKPAELGKLFNASHESMSRDYEVSTPEVDRLVAIAQGQRETLGARLTGGGFGGSIVGLVKPGTGAQVAKRVLEEYQKATGVKRGMVLLP